VYFRAVFYGATGYADESRGILFALARAGMPLQIEPVEFQHDVHGLLPAHERERLERVKLARVDLARSVLLQDFPAHGFSLSMYGRARVGRTMYETDSLPEDWLEYCQAMDQVWVPSTFNCETFAAAGVARSKLRALPEGVDTGVYRPGAEPLPLPGLRGFRFLSIFEWIERKGPDVLLRAYLSEFRPDEDVCLILKAYARPDPAADLLPRIAWFIERELGMRLEDTAPIVVLAPGFLRAEELPRLYATASAFVLPTRGEGWGRPFMESLACARPVITSRWSGQMDFLHDGNSYLIDVEPRPAAWNIDVELSAGHGLGEPSGDHLRQLMRRVFTHRDEAQQRAQAGCAEMRRKWDWDVVVRQHWLPAIQALLD
jgi:glycosyltransferase involved in cell wall biosynthesis